MNSQAIGLPFWYTSTNDFERPWSPKTSGLSYVFVILVYGVHF